MKQEYSRLGRRHWTLFPSVDLSRDTQKPKNWTISPSILRKVILHNLFLGRSPHIVSASSVSGLTKSEFTSVRRQSAACNVPVTSESTQHCDQNYFYLYCLCMSCRQLPAFYSFIVTVFVFANGWPPLKSAYASF